MHARSHIHVTEVNFLKAGGSPVERQSVSTSRWSVQSLNPSIRPSFRRASR